MTTSRPSSASARLLVLALATAAAPAAAQMFPAELYRPVTPGLISYNDPIRVEAGDLDGDGRADVVLLAPASGDGFDTGVLTVYTTSVQGTLVQQAVHLVSPSAKDVALADLDLDGDLDVAVVASQPGKQLQVLLNDGAGTLAPLPPMTTVSGHRLFVGHADDDRIPDLFSWAKPAVEVLVGNGDGTFAPPVLVSAVPVTGASHARCAVGDLNGDGISDVVAQGEDILENAMLNVLMGHGGATFSPWLTTPLPSAVASILLLDVDRDGWTDVVVSRPDAVEVLSGDGHGGLAPAVATATGFDGELAAADLDGDGWTDVVLSGSDFALGSAGSRAVVLENDGTGRLAAPTTTYPQLTTTDVALADLDLDGHVELIGPGVTVLRGEPGGFLSIPGQLTQVLAKDASVGDVDEDGHADVALPNSSTVPGATAKLLLGDGQGGFPTTVDLGPPALQPQLALADMDGDGHLDLVRTSIEGFVRTVTVLLGDGTGGFVPASTQPVSPAVQALRTGDFDGDGHLDVLAATTFATVFVDAEQELFLGGGDGTLAPPLPLALEDVDEWPLPADLDADGHAELLVVHDTPVLSQELVVWSVDGLGVMTKLATHAVPQPGLPAPSALTTADLDEDGHLDVLLAGRGGIAFYAGDGLGGLSPGVLQPLAQPVAGGADAVVAADLDADGHLDVATATNGRVLVRFGDGTGALGPESSFFAWSGGAGLFAADLDEDGLIDLLTGGAYVSSFLNAIDTGSWLPLGHGLAGAAAVPRLAGLGTTVAGSGASLRLTRAAPSAPVTLVVGLSAGLLPFKGGTLVPQPEALVGGLMTGATGEMTLAVHFPSGLPAASTIYVQAWIVDMAGPAGLSASNGLAATTH